MNTLNTLNAMNTMNTSTMSESIRPEEIDEEDETDGWGPVRVRRSSIPTGTPAVHETHEPRETQKAAEPEPERDAAGNIIEPSTHHRPRTLR
jgi:hypothetical protein